MSFDLLDRPLVWIPVTWPGLAPSDVEGEVAKVVEHRVDIQVEILPRDELERMFYPKGDAEPVDDFDAFKRIAQGWRKLVAHGRPVEFTDDNIRLLLNVSGFPTALQTHYLKACAGKVETREGNSDASPSDGRAGEA